MTTTATSSSNRNRGPTKQKTREQRSQGERLQQTVSHSANNQSTQSVLVGVHSEAVHCNLVRFGCLSPSAVQVCHVTCTTPLRATAHTTNAIFTAAGRLLLPPSLVKEACLRTRVHAFTKYGQEAYKVLPSVNRLCLVL